MIFVSLFVDALVLHEFSHLLSFSAVLFLLYENVYVSSNHLDLTWHNVTNEVTRFGLVTW